MVVRLLLIFLGAGLGGVLRYLIGVWVRQGYAGAFPVETLLINLAGCLAVGFFATVLAEQFPGQETLRLAVLVGVLGGFTTFSSFGRETFLLINDGRRGTALAYVLLSNCLGVALAFAGHALARRG